MTGTDYTFRFPEDFDTFSFPDGQLHVKFRAGLKPTVMGDRAIVEAKIRNPQEFFGFLLMSDLLAAHGFSEFHLKLLYLTGSRMDRAISKDEPCTLRAVCNVINEQDMWDSIHVFCPHSSATTNLLFGGLAAEMHEEEIRFYQKALSIAFYRGGDKTPAIFLPDVEGQKRFYNKLHKELNQWDYGSIICGNKKRDMETGKLSGFEVFAETVPDNVVIVDDLIEKGGTFIGQAKILRDKGAKFITLATPHAILSGGYDLPGIDLIVATDSYNEHKNAPSNIVILKVNNL